MAFASLSVGFELPETSQDYVIKVELDPEAGRLTGSVEISWDYQGDAVINEIPVNLYMNAFAHSETTWLREKNIELSADEKRETFEKLQKLHSDPWGYSKLLSVEQDGIPITWQAIQPDDGNVLDNTLIELTLAEPVSRDKSLKLVIKFEAKLPVPHAPFRRTGGFGDYFFMAQWYPKLSLYEEGFGFVKGQFHADTEFYADFADYHVEITAPDKWVVGATGEQINKQIVQDVAVHVFEQKAVHDFAFLVAKNFVERVEYFERDDGSQIELHYFMEKDHEYQVPRFNRFMQQGIAKFEKHIGRYPYQTLSIIFPSFAQKDTAGMEYPTLITVVPAGEIWDQFPLSEFRMIEMVALHEFGHQYFYGFFASNERRNAFLDEGFNSYWEGRIMSEIYGKTSSWGLVAGRRLDGKVLEKAGPDAAEDIRESVRKQPSWLYYPGTSGRQVYNRPADTLMTAGNLYGNDIIDDIFHAYYKSYVFQHPNQNDFFQTVKSIGGKKVFNLISEGLSEPELPNYKVAQLESQLRTEPVGYNENEQLLTESLRQLDDQGMVWVETTDPGWFDMQEQFTREGSVQLGEERLLNPSEGAALNPPETTNAPQAASFYESRVRIEGPAWRYLPIALRFTFSDGKVLSKQWDGRAAWQAYRLLSGSKLVKVEIDPEQLITLDNNPLDNSLSLESDKLFVWEKSTWLAAFIQWFSTGVLTWI